MFKKENNFIPFYVSYADEQDSDRDREASASVPPGKG